MNILIAHLGSPSECFISTSILKGLPAGRNSEVDILVNDDRCAAIFEYNKKVRQVFTLDSYADLEGDSHKYDLLINLHPSFTADDSCFFPAVNKLGFWFSPEHDYFYDIFLGKKKTSISLFQMYFKLAGLKWKGQKYDFVYFPQTRSKRTRTGIALANNNLERYIEHNLKLDQSKLWHIPLKDSVFRRLDEINTCSAIITDDFFTANLAIFLGKKVHFLKTVNYNMKMEFFGKGQTYEVPNNILL